MLRPYGHSFDQQHNQWSAMLVTNRVRFGIQPAFCPADTAGNNPPFNRPAAVRCAVRRVQSIISVAGASDAARQENIRSKTPSFDQRTKRLYSVLCGPYSAGASRQRKPFPITWMMPLTTRRSSTRGTPWDKGIEGFDLLSLDFCKPKLI